MTPEEFFAYAEQHPDRRFDFIDGEVVETTAKPLTGYIRAGLAGQIGALLRTNPVGVLHMTVMHVLDGENFIPDIAVTRQKAHDRAYFDQPPLLAVEIRSDTQSRTAQRRKALRYLAHGIPAVLLVMPGEQVELFMQQNDEPQIFGAGETVQDIPGFEGLEIDVKGLFE